MIHDEHEQSEQGLVFTSKLIQASVSGPRYSARFLARLAALPEEAGGNALRAQIERAAAAVPPLQRKRVLGALTSKSSSDDQVRSTVGTILLAKTLEDLGWEVEHEPEIDAGTPDLKISKQGESFLVEVRRVAGVPQRAEPSMGRIRDLLEGVETRTPIMVTSVSVTPINRSLKRFKEWLEILLAKERGPGPYVFTEPGVTVVLRLTGPFPEPMPAFFGSSGRFTFGGQHNEVRAHLREKLAAYKVPLVVALDFVDPLKPFRSVEDALFGQKVVNVPIDLSGTGKVVEPTPGRAEDGLLAHRGADGQRARTRLQAVLPFYLQGTEEGPYSLVARVLSNPAAEELSSLSGFRPIPRLLMTAQTHDHRVLRYVGDDDQELSHAQLSSWRHVP